jgi:NAD(P)-dependent dehydrogenase (short-subunit alcohol dehydrogenase family)
MASSKLAAIFGAGPGNGAAFAKKFLAQGYVVACCSRSAEKMADLAASLGPTEKIKGYACDVTSDASVDAAVERIKTDFGTSIHTVIYNAGSGGFKPIDEWTPHEIVAAADINAAGLFRVAKAVKQDMTEGGGGNICVIGAGASLRGRPATVGFASGKAAQRSVAQSLARAYGPEKIHVSYIVLDGIVLSERTKAWKPADKGDDFFIHSDDIADAVWNLCNQPESTWTFELDLRPFGESW